MLLGRYQNSLLAADFLKLAKWQASIAGRDYSLAKITQHHLAEECVVERLLPVLELMKIQNHKLVRVIAQKQIHCSK
ncbi:hypothetical protein D9M73_226320 [compost metagenome]